MAGPISLQQLVDAGTDATVLANVVNGPATGPGSTVVTRFGVLLPTIAAAIRNVQQNLPSNLSLADATVTPGPADANGNITQFTRDINGAALWFIGGARQKPGIDYTENGLVVTFATPVDPKVTVSCAVLESAAAPVIDVLNMRDTDPAKNGAIVPVTVSDGVVTTPF